MLTACGSSDSIDKNKDESAAKLQIISSIKPIHAIVLAIAGEHAQSEQLIPDYASPHNYSFKPSDIRKVKNADVIFRIDEHMETQLNTVFENLESGAQLISLAEAKGLDLLESGDSHHDDENDKHEGHENIDFHIWTSPKNAKIIASLVSKKLIELDENNAKIYQQNLDTFIQLIEDESLKISTALAKHQNSDYIVFHNSWQYFAKEFGLQKPIIVTLHEGISSGAKKITEIRNKIATENIQCVFYDASISEARLKLLTETVNTAKIDVLAVNIESNQSTYINWLKQLAEQVQACLSVN